MDWNKYDELMNEFDKAEERGDYKRAFEISGEISDLTGCKNTLRTLEDIDKYFMN